MEAKLSEQLRQLLQSKDASELVDVIVELHHDEEDNAETPQTRNQRIVHLKETLNRKLVPLQETIQSIGGEVTGQVWLNQTLRVRLPADKVGLLCDHDEVARLDVTHSLQRDT
jgi:hypothetical protein